MSTRKLCLYLQVPNSLKEIFLGSNNFEKDELIMIYDALPDEVHRDYFKKSKYTVIKLGQ